MIPDKSLRPRCHVCRVRCGSALQPLLRVCCPSAAEVYCFEHLTEMFLFGFFECSAHGPCDAEVLREFWAASPDLAREYAIDPRVFLLEKRTPVPFEARVLKKQIKTIDAALEPAARAWLRARDLRARWRAGDVAPVFYEPIAERLAALGLPVPRSAARDCFEELLEHYALLAPPETRAAIRFCGALALFRSAPPLTPLGLVTVRDPVTAEWLLACSDVLVSSEERAAVE